MGLDGDAALALEVHGVEHLGLHLAHGERSGQLQQAVRQRGFTVVDVRDDRKVAEESGVHSSVASGQLSVASKPDQYRPGTSSRQLTLARLRLISDFNRRRGVR